MKFTRGEGGQLLVLGVVFAAAGALGGYVADFNGVTFAVFNAGIVLGALMILIGLVAVTGLLDRD